MVILALIWSLVAFVLIKIYNSSIISYLSVSYKKPEISTLEELANNNHYKVLSLNQSFSEIDIMVTIHQLAYATAF